MHTLVKKDMKAFVWKIRNKKCKGKKRGRRGVDVVKQIRPLREGCPSEAERGRVTVQAMLTLVKKDMKVLIWKIRNKKCKGKKRGRRGCNIVKQIRPL
ncbi:hypothetical protein QE152_g12497 [Popillia japonica]|uniref:Uncharacterized protein n=1 Tax=Popillia japonica TaxID=7064 RepID=A0AAW1LNY0_POPJA